MYYGAKIWSAELLVGVEYVLVSIWGYLPSWVTATRIVLHWLLVGVFMSVVLGDTVLPMMGRVGLKRLRWLIVFALLRLLGVVIAGTIDVFGFSVFVLVVSVPYHGLVLRWMLELGKSKYDDIRFVCLLRE